MPNVKHRIKPSGNGRLFWKIITFVKTILLWERLGQPVGTPTADLQGYKYENNLMK